MRRLLRHQTEKPGKNVPEAYYIYNIKKIGKGNNIESYKRKVPSSI
jgi:hypothetical protein